MNLSDLAAQQNQAALHGPLYQGSFGQNLMRYNPLIGLGSSSNWIPKRPAIEIDFDLYIDGCEETIEKDAQKTT